jgi:hypothetical protein
MMLRRKGGTAFSWEVTSDPKPTSEKACSDIRQFGVDVNFLTYVLVNDNE